MSELNHNLELLLTPTLNDPFSDMSPTSPIITSVDPANIPLPTSPVDAQLPSPSTPQGDTNTPTTSKVMKEVKQYFVRWD